MTAQLRPPLALLQFVDGSVHSAAAIDLVAELPLPAQTQVVLVTAQTGPSHAARMLALAQQTRARLALERRGLRVIGLDLAGEAAQRWRSLAAEWEPDLIVIGATSLNQSVAASPSVLAGQIVEQSHWPVLLARAPFHGLSRVLIPVDGPADSQAAVGFLARVPLPPADVRVLHVLSAAAEVEGAAPGRLGLALGPADVGTGQALVSQTLHGLKAAGLRARARVTQGDAADTLLRYTRAHKIDLTFAGARGRDHAPLGRVSRRLAYEARGSVVLMR